MPNDCWNKLTITSEDREELNSLITNEFQHIENSDYVYNETAKMYKRGCRGAILSLRSAWNPPYDFLENILINYPSCWIKNEWNEEGGFAGVWIGYVTSDGEKIIKDLQWDDLSIEDKHYLFMSEEEEKNFYERNKKDDSIRDPEYNEHGTKKKIIKKIIKKKEN